MLYTIDRDSLFEGLSKTISITDKRTSLPILSHVLIEVTTSSMILSATDLVVSVRMIFECDVQRQGLAVVPGRKLFEIVKEMSSTRLTFEYLPSGRIKITGGKSVFELSSLNPEDYPSLDEFTSVETAPIDRKTFLDMLEKTIFAASTDESRMILCGVLLEKDDEGMNAVATDSHRLGWVSGAFKLPLPARVILPRRGILELKRLLEGTKGEIFLGFHEKSVLITSDRFLMSIRLLEGSYPDYRRVIPQEEGKKFIANRLQLVQAVRRVGLLTSDHQRGIILDVVPGLLRLTASHPDLGRAEEELAVTYEGEPFTMQINYLYLLDALDAIDTETLSVEFFAENKPVVFKPVPAGNHFNIVMPIRREED